MQFSYVRVRFFRSRPIGVALVVCLSVLLSATAPRPALAHGTPPLSADQSPLVARGRDKQGLLEISLRTDGPAAPGQTVTLTLEATPTLDAAAPEVTWLLPAGVEMSGGPDSESVASIAARQRGTWQRQVLFPDAGLYRVTAAVGYAIGDGQYVSTAAILLFDVQASGGALLHQDPTVDIAQQHLIPTQVTVDEQVLAANADGDPCFTINGTLTRLDRNPTTANANAYADSRVPVHHVPVDLMEEDTIFDDYYGTRVTDAQGNFDFSFCDDDGVFDDELELYVVVHAEMWDNGFMVVEVEDSSWIDETHEFASPVQESEGGVLRFDMTMDLNHNPADYSAGAAFQSEVFNIADAIWDAYSFWNANGGASGDDAQFRESAEVHYEPGYDDDGSYYNPFWNEITVADALFDPDPWDDTVIIHEWTHFADDVYGCDDTPGGDHSIWQLTDDTELAWSEGYSNYYASAVRAAKGDPNAQFYLDISGAGMPGNRIDLETFDTNPRTVSRGLASGLNEGAIAAMLWDLRDGAPNDGNDRVGYGHRVTQEVFTDAEFESNGDIFDDQCTVYVYLRAWRMMGKPATRDTAAAVSQNIRYTPPGFDGVAASTASTTTAADVAVAPTPFSTGYRWWKQLTWVVDVSTSMAGAKLAGVKTVITEQLNDLDREPQGVDFNLYTFDHESNVNRTLVENAFYSDNIAPAINGLTTTSSFDLDCAGSVSGLNAVKQGLNGKREGNLWLFTDGRDAQYPRVDTVVQMLARQRIRASIALLGGCATPPLDPNRLNGTETYLGAAAGPQSSGIVPYLVTALRSGGQFLYVNPDQVDTAGDILRAQLGNSAGAGRWSDYVSDVPLYRWDRLDPNEYRWIDTATAAGGTYHGQLDAGAKQVFFPQPVTVYGDTTSSGWVNEDGYILMGNALDAPTLDVLYANLTWRQRLCGPRAAGVEPVDDGERSTVVAAGTNEVPCNTRYVELFTRQEGDWFALTTTGLSEGFNNAERTYQALINPASGEIRYQYRAVAPGDAGMAEVSITDPGSGRILVSNKDVNGPAAGTGYKFYWAPPQPTKTYTVTVDALMEGIGFMLTGYSGDTEPMVVRTPDGVAVDCNDTADVLCLSTGRVQYIQANVNGRSGIWTATVDAAPPTNQATFSFSALAASTVGAEIVGDPSPFSGVANRFLVNVGRATDDGRLTGWFQRPNGARWSADFLFYDDGAHDDLLAGDGLFGSDPVTLGAGAGFLWTRGRADGVDFVRADPAMVNVQPFSATAPQSHFANDIDAAVAVELNLANADSVYHCFEPDVTAPDAWASWSWSWDYDQLGPLCLGAGETRTHVLTVYPAWYEAVSGAAGEVTVSFEDVDNPAIGDGVTLHFTRRRGVASVLIDNGYKSTYLRPNGSDTADLKVAVFDEQGVAVADGVFVQMETTLGTVSPTVAPTVDGIARFTFTAATVPGDATITATAGAVMASTVIQLREALPAEISLTATPGDLTGTSGGSSALLARVVDRWGNPVANQSVRLGLEDDDQRGAIDGAEVVTLSTDGNGEAQAHFVAAQDVGGIVTIRAELRAMEDGQTHVVDTARTKITLDGQPAESKLYLPSIRRD